MIRGNAIICSCFYVSFLQRVWLILQIFLIQLKGCNNEKNLKMRKDSLLLFAWLLPNLFIIDLLSNYTKALGIWHFCPWSVERVFFQSHLSSSLYLLLNRLKGRTSITKELLQSTLSFIHSIFPQIA